MICISSSVDRVNLYFGSETLSNESEESTKTEIKVSEATIREIAKRKTAVRILKYLLEENEVKYTQEVADDLDIDPASADFYLKKLVCCDLIKEDEQRVDHRVRYYRISNKSAVERALEYYQKLVTQKEQKYQEHESEKRRSVPVEEV
jgi:predicted transcriptional regulator